MRRTLLRALLLVVASAALGLAVNAFSPQRIPYLRPPAPAWAADEIVSLTEAKQLWEASPVLFLDARAPEDYATGHIAFAENLPADSFGELYPAIAGLITPDLPVIVYCDGEDCDLSHRVMTELRQLGVTQARVLENGWTEWERAGLATRKGEQP